MLYKEVEDTIVFDNPVFQKAIGSHGCHESSENPKAEIINFLFSVKANTFHVVIISINKVINNEFQFSYQLPQSYYVHFFI